MSPTTLAYHTRQTCAQVHVLGCKLSRAFVKRLAPAAHLNKTAATCIDIQSQ